MRIIIRIVKGRYEITGVMKMQSWLLMNDLMYRSYCRI